MSHPIEAAAALNEIREPIREHGAALRRNADVMERLDATIRGFPERCGQEVRQTTPVIGQEVRDTTTHAAVAGSLGGGFLMVLWFIVKLILMYLASRK